MSDNTYFSIVEVATSKIALKGKIYSQFLRFRVNGTFPGLWSYSINWKDGWYRCILNTLVVTSIFFLFLKMLSDPSSIQAHNDGQNSSVVLPLPAIQGYRYRLPAAHHFTCDEIGRGENRVNRLTRLDAIIEHPLGSIVDYPESGSTPRSCIGHRFLVEQYVFASETQYSVFSWRWAWMPIRPCMWTTHRWPHWSTCFLQKWEDFLQVSFHILYYSMCWWIPFFRPWIKTLRSLWSSSH